MLQVYLLAASSAVKTQLAQRIQISGLEFGKAFYANSVAPLQGVIRGYVKNFRTPTLVESDDVDLVDAEVLA